jgi:hypothetical protein
VQVCPFILVKRLFIPTKMVIVNRSKLISWLVQCKSLSHVK